MERNKAIEYIESQLGNSLKNLESFPSFINIETINSCNARCIMCGIDFDGRPNTTMSDEIFEKIVGELAQHTGTIRKVNLYLDCEPLLDKNLHRRIRRLKEVGVKVVNIASNTSILTDRRGREIIEAGLDEIYITIDSLKKETYEAIRVRLNFDQVYKNARAFIKLRNELNPNMTIRVQMVGMDMNKGEEQGFIDHWAPLLNANDQVTVHMAHNWGGVVNVVNLEEDKNINEIPCTILWSNACIHADGSVALCSIDTVPSSAHSIGSMKTQSISDVWNDSPLRKVRERHLNGMRAESSICNGCTAWRPVNNHIYKHGMNPVPTKIPHAQPREE